MKVWPALVMVREADKGAVSFELKAALLGSHDLRLWLLYRMCLHNRYLLFKRKTKGFPNNLLRTRV